MITGAHAPTADEGLAAPAVLCRCGVRHDVSTGDEPVVSVAGRAAGDNVTFLWNIWWGREALAHGAMAYLYSPLLFAPRIEPHPSHAHGAAAMFGAVVLGQFSSVTAQNLIILATLTLNGFSAFLFLATAWIPSAPALMAGAVFGVSPVTLPRTCSDTSA